MVVRTERTCAILVADQHSGVGLIRLDIAACNADSLHPHTVVLLSAGANPHTDLIPAGRQPCGDRFSWPLSSESVAAYGRNHRRISRLNHLSTLTQIKAADTR